MKPKNLKNGIKIYKITLLCHCVRMMIIKLQPYLWKSGAESCEGITFSLSQGPALIFCLLLAVRTELIIVWIYQAKQEGKNMAAQTNAYADGK